MDNIKSKRVISGYNAKKGKKYKTPKGEVKITEMISAGRYLRA